MKRQAIKVRDIVSNPQEYYFNNLGIEIDVVLDDCVEASTTSEIYLMYPWLQLLSTYPNVRYVKDIYIHHHTDLGLLSVGGIINMASAIRREIINSISVHDKETMDAINRGLYEARNDFYNLVYVLEKYTVGGDIRDFIEIHKSKTVRSMLDKRLQSQEWVSKTHNTTLQVLREAKEVSANNEIRKAILSKNVNTTQAMQCIGPRGTLTDIDGSIYPTVITRGYSEGLNNIVFIALDSRMAAKALFYADDMIRKAEYFARRLQIITINIESIQGDDCGSDNYLEWNVGGELDEDGNVKDWGSLPFLAGSYYLAEDGTLREILGNEKDLIGKTIKKRWVIGCRNKDSKTKCKTCFGTMHFNIPENTNIGHRAASTLTDQTTQRVLSVKHKMGSTVDTTPYITKNAKKYFEFKEEYYYLTDPKVVKIGIPLEAMRNLSSISSSSNKETSIGNIDTVTLYYSDDLRENTTVRIIRGTGGITLSEDFIKYIRSINIRNIGTEYVFDLSGWKPTAIFKLVPKEYGYHEHLKDIETGLFTLNDKNTINKTLTKSPADGLIDLYDKVNPELHMNITYLELIICSLCARDPANGDYRLPNGGNSARMVKADMLVRNRSMSVLYTYEKMTLPLYTADYIGLGNRQDHLYDVLIKPNEVISSL